MIVPLTLIAFRWRLFYGPFNPMYDVNSSDVVLTLAPLLSLISIPLLGLCAFHADQWHRGYRFLADRGIPPKYVWLSRQSIAFGPPLLLLAALLLAAVILATLRLPNPLDFPRSHGAPLWEMYAAALVSGYSFFAVFGYLVLGITVGQLASMFLRSGLLAGLLCIVLTNLLAGWSAVMCVWHVSWLWSVLPIPGP